MPQALKITFLFYKEDCMQSNFFGFYARQIAPSELQLIIITSAIIIAEIKIVLIMPKNVAIPSILFSPLVIMSIIIALCVRFVKINRYFFIKIHTLIKICIILCIFFTFLYAFLMPS